MTTQIQELIIRRPDDWHIHLRDSEMLDAVVPFTSEVCGRGIVMPNLTPPVTSIAAASAYRERIMAAVPAGNVFTPLMTCYLTDGFDPNEIERGFNNGVFIAAKLYPAYTTTNSAYGVTSITVIASVLERMQKIGMPLLIHCEVTDAHVDVFDREARFIESVLDPLRQQFPELKIVCEHISTKEASAYVLEGNNFLAATITPQHLMFDRNDMLMSGIRPHLYCLPILKRHIHQQALRDAVASGHQRLFLGTDTAPHTRDRKEASCGCAGVFNAPSMLSAYATVFEEIDALEHFEAFCAENGPNFYGLPLNKGTIKLVRKPWTVAESITVGKNGHTLVPFLAGETLNWRIDTQSFSAAASESNFTPKNRLKN